MLPRRTGDGPLGIDEQNVECVRMGSQRRVKIIQGRIPGPTSHDIPSYAPISSCISQPDQKPPEPTTDSGFGFLLVAASLHVDPNLLGHGVPPISPIRHNSPRLYFSIHSLSRSLSSRL